VRARVGYMFEGTVLEQQTAQIEGQRVWRDQLLQYFVRDPLRA
jgi:hypothetical protein